jgi:DNA-nicking Smr family endonuclease
VFEPAYRYARETQPILRRSKTPEPARDIWLDLHGSNKAEAVEIVHEALTRAQRSRNTGTIRFCTGRGLHSPGGMPVLRPIVQRMCKEYGCTVWLESKGGVVCCRIGRGKT